LKKQNQIGIVYAIIATLIWSGNFIVSRYAIHLSGPISLAWARWSMATICLFPFAIKDVKKEFHIVKQNPIYFLFMGFIGFALYHSMIYTAGHYTTAINLALIGSTIHPIVAAVLGTLVIGEVLNWKNITGILLCIIGTILLITKGNVENVFHLHFSKGDLWMVGAGTCFGTYNVFVRKKPLGISNNSFLLVLFGIGAIMLTPFALYEMNYVQPIIWNSTFIWIIVYLGIGNSIISYYLWNISIHTLGASKTALFGTMLPLLSSIEAVYLLGESFSIFQIISGVVILLGILINTWPTKPKSLLS
jgi:drug/metabolite transporter (DMT)-like permease